MTPLIEDGLFELEKCLKRVDYHADRPTQVLGDVGRTSTPHTKATCGVCADHAPSVAQIRSTSWILVWATGNDGTAAWFWGVFSASVVGVCGGCVRNV